MIQLPSFDSPVYCSIYAQSIFRQLKHYTFIGNVLEIHLHVILSCCTQHHSVK